MSMRSSSLVASPVAHRWTAALVAVVLAALLVAGCATPIAPGWTAQPPVPGGATPSPVTVAKVDCGSPTFCVAVPADPGGFTGARFDYGERWDGTAWSPVERPPGSLFDLSCAATYCMAVGIGPDQQPQAWSWTGTGAWSMVAGAEALLATKVECLGTDRCVASGTNPTSEARLWDGTGWSVIWSAPAATPYMDDFACLAPNLCVFASSDLDAVSHVDRWDGSTVTAMPLAAPARPPLQVLCGSTLTSCLVLPKWYSAPPGEPETTPIALRWSGSAWVTGPVWPGELRSVSCAPDGTCMATGYTPDGSQTAVHLFDGSTWRLAPGGFPVVGEVACASASLCFGIGPANGSSTSFQKWDGRGWTTISIPPATSRVNLTLDAVSCVSASWCLAAGWTSTADIDAPPLPTVQRWDGSSWRMHAAPPPRPSSAGTLIAALSCASEQRCVAVGASAVGYPGNLSNPYLARWDGTRWFDESPTMQGRLTDVSCEGSTCVAVGWALTGNVGSMVAYVSDGGAWSSMPVMPTTISGYDLLGPDLRVDCATAGSCAAAILLGGTGSRMAYWDGTAWSAAVPLGDANSPLSVDVSCPAAGRCLVGWGTNATDGGVATWSGAGWATTTVGSGVTRLSCAAAGRCLALGPADDTALSSALVYDGTAWSTVAASPAPPALADFTTLGDVDCAGTACMAVGKVGSNHFLADPVAYRWGF